MDPTATETPTPNEGEDQSQSTQAPSQETSAPPETQDEQFTTFRLEDVPEDRREYVEQAYKQLQGDYTRKTQALAEQRRQAETANAVFNDLQSDDPELRQHALQWMAQNGLLTEDHVSSLLPQFGYELDDQEEDPEDDDPVSRLATEWESFKAQQQQEKARQDEEHYISRVDEQLTSEIDRINADRKQAGRPELSAKQARLIVKNALVDTDPGQMPDVQAAYDEFVGVMDEGLKAWSATKQTTHTASGGQAATQVPDLDNERERHEWMRARLQAGPPA